MINYLLSFVKQPKTQTNETNTKPGPGHQGHYCASVRNKIIVIEKITTQNENSE